MEDELHKLIKGEETRQQETITLIPSENYASHAVREAVGSVLANKYSEGYPGKRYYQGNFIVDQIEQLAIDRTKSLFGVPHVNVQPYSGSPANSEVLFALCNPFDSSSTSLTAGAQGRPDAVMGMQLSAGGHLTHGHPNITFSGKYFRSVQFGLDENGKLNYEDIRKLAEKEKPKVMFIGTTAYPLAFSWEKFAEIADAIAAYLVADISHVVGLVLGGVYPNPVPHAHVITTTTHKTLRGPRGAVIMVTGRGLAKDLELTQKIDRAVFPGMQGGPHNNTTAGIAQALYEASQPEFTQYAKHVIENAKVLAEELLLRSSKLCLTGRLQLVSGGTESHLMVVDLRPLGLSGNVVAEALEVAGIIVNRNSVPNDPQPPFYPSGIRLGTPAVTTRGMGEEEMKKIAGWIIQVINQVKDEKLPKNPEERSDFLKSFKKRIKDDKTLLAIQEEVRMMCAVYPIPQ